MEKYFVTYNQAFKLKELGFDETCLAYYDGWNGQTDLIITDENPKFLTKLFNLFSKNKYSSYTQDYVEYLGGFCTAPLKSQVFEWFRKNYDLVIEQCVPFQRTYQTEDDYFEILEFGYRIFEFDQFRGGRRNTIEWDGYENSVEEIAESACIDKLIEIVKNK